MRRSGAVLVTTILAASALGGCGGGSDGTAVAPTLKRFSVETALQELPPMDPSDDRPLQAFASDFALATQLGDLPKPDDQQSTSAWLQAMNGAKVWISAGEGLGLQRLQTGAMRRVLGFDARDITTTSTVESLPDAVTVVHLSSGVTPKEVTTTGDGKIGDIDPAATGDAPFPQIFGVTLQGDQVALAKTQKALDTWKARGDASLADYEPFLEVAQALDAHRIYDAVLSDRPGNVRPFSQEVYDQMEVSMPDFDAVGVAQGVEDGEAVEYIAYRVKDLGGAEERIQAVWDGGISISGESFESFLDFGGISTKGKVVTVKVFPRDFVGVAAQMLLKNDTAFFVLK